MSLVKSLSEVDYRTSRIDKQPVKPSNHSLIKSNRIHTGVTLDALIAQVKFVFEFYFTFTISIFCWNRILELNWWMEFCDFGCAMPCHAYIWEHLVVINGWDVTVWKKRDIVNFLNHGLSHIITINLPVRKAGIKFTTSWGNGKCWSMAFANC